MGDVPKFLGLLMRPSPEPSKTSARMSGKNAMPKKLRVFLDTSAILAGLNSPTGAAGIILAACFSKVITPVISPEIIVEGERVIQRTFPHLRPAWASFLLLPPAITKTPTLAQVKKAYRILPTSDAPILASAIQTRPDVLITWNTRHFMQPAVLKSVTFSVCKPGDFLPELRRLIS